MFKGIIKEAPFKEHPIVDCASIEADEFDVVATHQDHSANFIIAGKFSNKQYCLCLLNKLFSFTKSRIKPFIVKQCEQVNDPFTWLNKLEKLIDVNRDLYTTKEHDIIKEKALMVIELIRQEIENNKFNKAARFDFDRIKGCLKNYKTVGEQIICLNDAKADYQINKPRIIDPTETPFDKKCEIEIDRIEKAETIKSRMPQREALLNGTIQKNKIKVRGHINVLGGAFHDMLHKKKADGLPYLDITPGELVSFIANNFVDKDGHPLSENTIRTILTPSRADKRPKDHNKIDLG